MTLREQIIDDASAIHLQTDDFAEAASYTPSGSSASTINVAVEQWQKQEPVGQADGMAQTIFVSFYCSIADVPTVTPYEDTVSIRGVTFVVRNVGEQDIALQRIDAESVDPTRKSREGFERTR